MNRSALVFALLLFAGSTAALFSSGRGVFAGGPPGPVAAGGKHSCAVTPAGGVKCWGGNESGQLGNGSTLSATTPVNVSGLSSGAASVSAGLAFTCVLTTSGGVKCWGSNDVGQLGATASSTCGTPPHSCNLTPLTGTGLSSGVAAISAGRGHACALLTGGAIKCWGNNEFGQLGDGTTGDSRTPVDVALPEGATEIAAGPLFTCARTTPGGAKCWGDNAFGQLGDGTTDPRSSPVQVSGLTSGVRAVGAGGEPSFGHACAALEAGGAQCWGNNEYGQLGDERVCHSPTVCSTPVAVHNLSAQVTAITGGNVFTCALSQAGAVKCWGHNDFGQLGDNFTCGSLCAAPVDVDGLSSGVMGIATGVSHACASRTAGVRCWGDNFDVEVGDGGQCGTICPSPMDVSGLSGGMNGDVNCDHAVNSIDAALVLQLGAGLLSSVACRSAADTNHDGRINAVDAALILQYSAGILHSLA